jgi:hypothetical protein
VPRHVDLGHETRGPLVVPVSDRAVQDADVRHGLTLSRSAVAAEPVSTAEPATADGLPALAACA